jgi:GH24 family phage-related lysozyme (muramidase)
MQRAASEAALWCAAASLSNQEEGRRSTLVRLINHGHHLLLLKDSNGKVPYFEQYLIRQVESQSKDQHRIPEGVKTVVCGNGVLVKLENTFTPGEG